MMRLPFSSRSIRSSLLALLLLGALAACDNKQGPSLPPAKGEGAPPPPQIPTLEELAAASQKTATAAPVDRVGTGTLQPLHLAALGPKETGVITAIAVDEGDRVRKGQLLFRLDSAQPQLAVGQAKAAVAAAQVQLASAKLDYERTQALRARNTVPEDALDQAKTRFDAATTGLQQAEAALALVQRRAADTVVNSPIDGIVSERRMNVGETATLMPPSIVLVVQDIDRLELRARLPETALRTVREGSLLNVSFPALEETRVVTVKRIAPTIDQRTRTIEIVAEVENKDHRLKAGMLAEIALGDAPKPAEKAETSGTEKPAKATKAAAAAAKAERTMGPISDAEEARAR